MDERRCRRDGENCNYLLRLKTIGKEWKIDLLERRMRRPDLKSKKCGSFVTIRKCMIFD